MAYQNPLITLGSHGKIHINEYNPVKVPQEMPKFLSLDPTALNEDKTAHSTRFRIQSNVEWEVTSSTTWCTVSPTSGWGDNWITCWLQANGEDNPRTSNITVTSPEPEIGSRTLMLTQLGATVTHYLTCTPNQITGEPSAAHNIEFYIESDISWSVSCSKDWVTVNTTSGTGNKIVSLSIASCANIILSGSRSATIKVKPEAGSGLDTVEITLKQNDGNNTSDALSVDRIRIDQSSAAISVPVTVTSNCSWTVTPSASWLSVIPTSGFNNGSIVISISENGSEYREANVKIEGPNATATKSVKVCQQAGVSSLTVQPDTIEHDQNTGDFTFNITSNISWNLAVIEGSSWLSVQEPTSMSGSGNAVVRLFVTNNSGINRTGKVRVSGTGVESKYVTVNQAGPGGESHNLTISPDSIVRYSSSSITNLYITTDNDVDWTIEIPSTAPWLEISSLTGTGTSTVQLSIPHNYGSPRTTTLSVTGTGVTETKYVTINQQGDGLSTNVWPTYIKFNAGTGQQVRSCTVVASGEWTADVTGDPLPTWVTVSKSSDSELQIRVYQNLTGTTRNATIRVTCGDENCLINVEQTSV